MKWIAAGPVRSELEAALQMVEKHHIKHADIEAVDILTNARTATLKDTAPPNLLACKFSTPYIVAQALIGVPRDNFLDEAFTHEAYENPAWRTIAQRIRMTVSDDYSKAFETAPNTSRPCTMTIKMKNGQSYTHNVAETKGHSATGAPPTSDYTKKFRMITEGRLAAGNVDRIIDLVGRLDTLDNVRTVLDACH
jgi:2-methylcitrate dehydratase PrpD